MESLSVQVEKTSNIVRKLTIKVPAQIVSNRFERGLVEVQKTAKLKGFRPGQAPISVIKQFYGDDVRHNVFHSLIDESFREAVKAQQLKAVGSPKIDAAGFKTGEGEHDHSIRENEDFTFIATVEVLPEIEVKSYTGISLTKEASEVTDEQVTQVVQGLLDSQAQLVPVTSGLVSADGSSSSRPVQKKDYVEIAFTGGIVTENGIEQKDGMKGSRMLEVGSESLIPGFEDHLVGMRQGETKTFRIPFPTDFYEKDMAGKDAEFTVTVNEVKEKKLPALDDEFAKQAGYENLTDMNTKAKEYLLKEKATESDRKLRNDLLQTLIEKNPFDVPAALIESQARSLIQDWAEELGRQGATEQVIREMVGQELENIRKRAESQVRASLILEAISKKEKIEIDAAAVDAEIARVAVAMKVEEQKLRDFYAKEPGRKEDLEFRLRQDATLKFLLDKAKIKSKS